MQSFEAYVISARRSALGRVGGLHRSRRIEELAEPVIAAVLNDAGLAAGKVEGLIVGNASLGGNPARLIALAAGLPETAPAQTIDMQCASGLEAIVRAIRDVSAGVCDVMLAGGAEALSMAPWRIAKPRNLYQLPRFLEANAQAPASTEPGQAHAIAASDELAHRLGIGRARQDTHAIKSAEAAHRGLDEQRFVGEIVPLRISADEARDESLGVVRTPEDFFSIPPYNDPDGTVTSATSSTMHDGAAFSVVVSKRVYDDLGHPPALKLVAGLAAGTPANEQSIAPLRAVEALYRNLNGFDHSAIGVIELSESSCAQQIAFEDGLGLDDGVVNPDGGAVSRGHPYGASGAVLVVRLFTSLIRSADPQRPQFGLAALGAIDGLGAAALFERV